MTRADQAIHAVIAGTAGHIDHGKSSLVLALTGIDPDRLPEEKERGLTIDLGFANLALPDGRRMGLVDVPGHERFVRNMVAGCSAIDLAVLVVAADDGVMPQTREHVEILKLLAVRTGIVALTKIDMCDEETILMAEDDVRSLLAGTRLEAAEIVRVSSVTGEGIDALRARLTEIALGIEPRPADGPFRMPIQRVFTLDGIGTVVTGIPLSGSLESGGEVEFLPGHARSRVRALHAYGRKVNRAVAGHSTALSVPDADLEALHRGMVVADIGTATVGRAVDVQLDVLATGKPLEHRTPIRFHVGTAEVQGVLALLDRDSLVPGTSVVARVLLDDEVCTVPGDRFLLRQQNPVRTVGGGVVLRIVASASRYRRVELGDELQDLLQAGHSPAAQARKHLTHAGPAGRTVAELGAAMAMEPAGVEGVLAGLDDVHHHEATGRWFTKSAVSDGAAEVLLGVDRMLKSKPLAASVQKSALRTSRSLPQALLDAVIDHLFATGRVRGMEGGRLVFVERLHSLPAADRAKVDRIAATCATAEFRPPNEAELAAAVQLGGDAFQSALQRAQDEATVVRVGEHFYGAATHKIAMRAVRDNCQRQGGELDIPALRDTLGTSRKYLIPLLEHFDAVGLTRLRGGVRVLLPSSRLIAELGP